MPLLAEALYDGGVRLLEVTFDACGKKSDAETAADIKTLAKKFKGRMYIGAGTVLTEKQVRLTKKAGGSFIISPNTDKGVITESRMCGLVSIPGVKTVSETLENMTVRRVWQVNMFHPNRLFTRIRNSAPNWDCVCRAMAYGMKPKKTLTIFCSR